MASFDVGLVHRLAEQLEGLAQGMKQRVNSPDELQDDVNRMTSILNSLQTLAKEAKNSGSNPMVHENDVR
ncbi:hypothetical protein KDJ56_15885 [Brevibacillus composti]|uniref:Uncharacterized protein n=1 Tax=Brevibacillus composti TaxID=2796470 RepID=A0A7T5JMR6_9BACL|nr:hypothetical protein [Brevibacillus composti]QQE73382.1 hypothetical protein JD108_15940 [Brevibacillus composti]QUO40463.1 hypothetical protein KDJ56_15885 [Brevibacillus composti]